MAALNIGEDGEHTLSLAILSLARQKLGDIYDQYKADRFRSFTSAELQRLAYALERLDLDRDSVEVLRIGVERDPESRPLRFQLARTLSNLGQYEAAEEQYTILLKDRY
ncbi:MAG: hypothetical protein PVH19_04580 [Planctomycetia bacterium]